MANTIADSNRRLIRMYHMGRNNEPLSEWQENRVKQLLDDWKMFRSDKPMTVYIAYGIHDFPIIYTNEQEVDQYVIEELGDLLDDEFEYCVERSIMTGREYGQLSGDW